MRDVELMQMLLAGGSSWIEATCLLGLFGLVLFHPEGIANWRLFRLAYVFLALSIAMPPLILCAFQAEPGMFAQAGNTGSRAGPVGISLALSAIGPLFISLTIVCAFGSILPRRTLRGAQATVPAKHPLD